MMDFILNGNGVGSVANALVATNFDTNVLRPYVGTDGRSYITQYNAQGKAVAVPVQNGTATLRKDDWKQLDGVIVKAAQPRLKAVADLRGAGLEFGITNGMGKTVLETETVSDISDAEITMDGIERANADRPEFELKNLPLPIIHKNFHFTARQIAASRNGGSPLDTTTAELASRKVAETAEKLLIGSAGSYMFGGGALYGYTNFPSRITATLTSPTASGWTPGVTVGEVLGMIEAAQGAFHYGPYVVYYGPSWNRYMNDEYKAQSDNTLRMRLSNIDGIGSVRQLDYLSGFDILLVQMTQDVVREVVGMEITTLQWETHGGMQFNFKVMAILCPQLRADHYGRTGIVHATVAP